MKLSDAPHPVGTPEHGEWVRNVFIPSVRGDRYTTDRRHAGAESIGAQLVCGGWRVDPNATPRITYTLRLDTERFANAMRDPLDAIRALNVGELLAAIREHEVRSIIASQRRRRHK